MKGNVNLSQGAGQVQSSKMSIICFYNTMIKNAKSNIGKTSSNGMLIDEKMISVLTRRRAELLSEIQHRKELS